MPEDWEIYAEGFASAVFVWLFLTFSMLTALLILRLIERVVRRIGERMSRGKRDHEAIIARYEQIAQRMEQLEQERRDGRRA